MLMCLEAVAGYHVRKTAANLLETHRMVEAMKHAFALRMLLGVMWTRSCCIVSGCHCASVAGRSGNVVEYAGHPAGCTWLQQRCLVIELHITSSLSEPHSSQSYLEPSSCRNFQ